MDEDLFELILQIGTYNGEGCYDSYEDMLTDKERRSRIGGNRLLPKTFRSERFSKVHGAVEHRENRPSAVKIFCLFRLFSVKKQFPIFF